MSETRELEREAEAARSLLANIRDVMAIDDGEAMTVVEGETNLIEAIGKAVDRIGELKAHEARAIARAFACPLRSRSRSIVLSAAALT